MNDLGVLEVGSIGNNSFKSGEPRYMPIRKGHTKSTVKVIIVLPGNLDFVFYFFN